jgi:amino acid transporter
MDNDTVEFSNRTLVVMLVVMVISWIITLAIYGLLFHESLESLIVTSMVGAIFIIVMMGFTVYRYRFRDERTIRILEKSGRNGFFFMIYLLPFVIILYSLMENPFDVVFTLVIFWISSIVVVAISAIYYYRE